MDIKHWPWKKKSSDKHTPEKVAASVSSIPVSCIDTAHADKAKQENNKKPKYVQISLESYTHLTGLEDRVKSYEEQVQNFEDQVKSYEDQVQNSENRVKSYEEKVRNLENQVKSSEEQVQNLEDNVSSYEEQVRNLEDEVKDLSDKLSEANLELINKEKLVKQHAKVAEEAVSGWEKAEAEAAALKSHLESVTLLKHTAEDRASHLDGALKECMRQIRNLKEEHDQKINEIILEKAKLFDKMKQELEVKIANLDDELLRSAADNAALSRSLHERASMLIQMSEEKSQAEAEIQRQKSSVDSCEREINSLKYELHIAKKEAEIHKEEKNMSMRSAEAANRQHVEAVKKITKLEAECQRLRGLVRKRLPGPAAIAQMKLEVESLGRDYGESRVKRSPSKSPTQFSQHSEFSLDSEQKYLKENEVLTERLLAMEEETKMLKEALAKRNSELQESRSLCAQAAIKLQALETQLQGDGKQRNPPKSNVQAQTDSIFCKEDSNLSSCTSMSEDGNDDNLSFIGSCSTGLMSELSHVKKEKNTDSPQKPEIANHMDLMDDFLEMEKLANLSNESAETVLEMEKLANLSNESAETVLGTDPSGNTDIAVPEVLKNEAPVEATIDAELQSGEQHTSESQVSPKDGVTKTAKLHIDQLIFAKLQSKVLMILDSISKEKDMGELTEDIRAVMQNIVELSHCSDRTDDLNTLVEGTKITASKEISLPGDDGSCLNTLQTTNQEMEMAIFQIYNFIMVLSKEAKTVLETSPEGDGLNTNLNMFSVKYRDAISRDTNLSDFVLDISHILTKASDLHFNVLGFKGSVVETGSSDCIDKIELSENKNVVDTVGERYPNGCAHVSDTASDPDVQVGGNFVPTSEITRSCKCSLEEFEQLKKDNHSLANELARSTQMFEGMKSQLVETEQLLTEVKSQLALEQKSNNLSETQLKCMAESYRTLESRSEELQTEINLLQGKIESLENELQEERQSHNLLQMKLESLESELEEERRNHQVAINRCKDLQDQLHRVNDHAAGRKDDKTTQEELAAAAEKLAECQDTIFLLGKQLKALRPSTDTSFPNNGRGRRAGRSTEEATMSGMNLQDTDPSDADTSTSSHSQRIGSPYNSYNAQFSPSDSEANNPLRSPAAMSLQHHLHTQSVSSSTSSTPTPEKHTSSIRRFFASKP